MTLIRPHMLAQLQEGIKSAKQPQQKELSAIKLQTLFKENVIRSGRMLGDVVIMVVPSLFSFFAVRRSCTANVQMTMMQWEQVVPNKPTLASACAHSVRSLNKSHHSHIRFLTFCQTGFIRLLSSEQRHEVSSRVSSCA